MRPPKSKRTTETTRTIQEILDSDDELLTTDYIETPFVPAYQDDTRFECWKEIKRKSDKIKGSPIANTLNLTKHVKKAIFNKKDTFCLQCVQHTIPANLFLWFFDFLLHKDSHSNHKFLSSCLVSKYENHYSRTIHESLSKKSNVRFKIVVN